MTTQSATPPTPGSTFAAVLRGTLVPALVLDLAVVLVALVWAGPGAAVSAALGVGVVTVFFAAGLALMARLSGTNAVTLMAAAMAVYLGQVLVLGLVGFALLDASWLDGTAFGLSAMVIVLAWQALQIRAFVRARKPVYDEPVANPETAAVRRPEPAGSADDAGRHGA